MEVHEKLVQKLKDSFTQEQAEKFFNLLRNSNRNILEDQLLKQAQHRLATTGVSLKEELTSLDESAFSQESLQAHLAQTYPTLKAQAAFAPEESDDHTGAKDKIIQAYNSFCGEKGIEPSVTENTDQGKPSLTLEFDTPEQALDFFKEKQSELPDGKFTLTSPEQFLAGIVDGKLYEKEEEYNQARDEKNPGMSPR